MPPPSSQPTRCCQTPALYGEGEGLLALGSGVFLQWRRCRAGTAVVRTTSLRGPWGSPTVRCHPNAHTATLCPWGTSPYDADAAHSHWGGGGDCVNPRRLVLPLAQATAAVRHRPRPVPWLQTPSRAAARRPGWRCPRPGPKAVPDVVGSAVAPQAARLGRREVPAKPLGCWPRRGGVHRSSRSRRVRNCKWP